MQITVAIPTIAGRTKYLESCVATCVSQDCDDMEILISDNSGGEAREFVNSLRDSRIRYVQPSRYLPMSAHWDFVLENATGDAITIIGDDDGLMPSCMRRLFEIYREYGNVPVHHSLCNFYWGDYIEESVRNTVVFHHDVFIGMRWIESGHYISTVCEGAASYVDGPMIYHNFMPLELMRRLSRDGIFFRRSSPDVYSAIAIAANIERFLSIGELLTISGQGARANGASFRTGGDDSSRFRTEMNTPQYRPRYSLNTVQFTLVDAILEVAKEYSLHHLPKRIDYKNHLWHALGEVRNIHSYYLRMTEYAKIGSLALRYKALAHLLLRGMSSTINHVRDHRRNKSSRNNNGNTALIAKGETIALGARVDNIYEASVALKHIVEQRARK